jgi:hypothetical protein
VKLTRVGSVFTAYISSDGVSWTMVVSKTPPITGAAMAGLFVCSHNANALGTATFDNVSFTQTLTLVCTQNDEADGQDRTVDTSFLAARTDVRLRPERPTTVFAQPVKTQLGSTIANRRGLVHHYRRLV